MTELSLLFVNYNSWDVLAGALESLSAHPPTRPDGSPMTYEVIVVDNASPDRDPARMQRVRWLLGERRGRLVLHGENGGYSKGMNLALRHASGELVLVSNPDVLFEPGCIDALARRLEADETVGAAAPVTFADRGLEVRLPTGVVPSLAELASLTRAAVSARGVRRHSRRRTPTFLPTWSAQSDLELAMFAGWCVLIPRRVIDRVGFFDERYPLYFEDADLSLRVRRAGWRIEQVHGARLVHLWNRSGRTAPELAAERFEISRRAFFRKWRGRLGGLACDAAAALLRTEWAKRRIERPRHAPARDVERVEGRPLVRLPRRCERFLVEVAYDPYFLLAAGTFGSGDTWSPGDEALAEMDRPTWFRVVELDADGRPRDELGLWRYDPSP